MEEAKHCSVEDITKILNEKFDALFILRKNAFVGTPLMTMAGSDRFRYLMARILVTLDRIFCRIGVVTGFDQIIVARKKQ